MIPFEIYMFIGFLLSSYAIVANDAIQTLGTFIAANRQRSWITLWLFVSGTLTIVLLYGWLKSGGDPAYGRLNDFYFDPKTAHQLYGPLCIIPPLSLLILTRLGLPVSTTFLLLTFFAPKNLISMVNKSLLGYGLALVVGLITFRLVRNYIQQNQTKTLNSTQPWWIVTQWVSTLFLWSQWLIQDLANLFIYFPRVGVKGQQTLSFSWLMLGLITMVFMQMLILREGGGKIQEIVDKKSGTNDIREAAIINLVYGLVILFFKEYSNMPMSTTWVFLGLLAGREIAYKLDVLKEDQSTWRMIGGDLLKATIGLVVSILIALGMQGQLLSFF
jgi:hypothetical protein